MIKEILFKLFRLEELPCHSCETLKMQLAIANTEKEKLLTTILEMNSPKPIVNELPRIVQPIQPKNIPWSVRQQMLEAEDRKAAQIIAERNRMNQILAQPIIDEEVEKLEKELGVENAN